MSVLVQGLKMPQGESCVTVRIWGDGRVIGVHNDSLVKHAIELPPHGDLIDRDAMEREVCGGCVHGEHKYSNCIDCALANAPTIIPASGGNEDE